MIKVLTTKLNLIAFFVSFALLFLIAAKAHALNSQEVSTKYSITFPITELGNCTDISSCRTYCEDPLNQQVCLDFAKKKGFHKEEGTAVKNAVLSYAKSELGCDSESSCKTFCGQQTNWEKCGDFAKKHNLSGGQVEDPAKKDVLTKAKEVLGCSSYDECKGFCTKEENRIKCDNFAKLVGLRGGVEKRGPGGCTSEETCKAFCSDPQNFQICQGYTKSYGEKFKGPGGCDSEESCRAFCKDHEGECKKYSKGRSSISRENYNPQEMCLKTPNCKWSNDRCECRSTYQGPQGAPAYQNADEYARFCREFPEKCASTSRQYSPYPTPSSSSGTSSCQPPTNGCGSYYFWDTSGCTCRSYEEQCKSSGCSWTGTTCQCSSTSNFSGSSSTPAPTQTQAPSQTSTQEPTSTSYDPATECAKHTGCSWTGSTCQCSGTTKGVSTSRSLLQVILDWINK